MLKEERILKSYIKELIVERGRFGSEGEEFNAWLIGVDCSHVRFKTVMNSFAGNEAIKNLGKHNDGAWIFNKDIISHQRGNSYYEKKYMDMLDVKKPEDINFLNFLIYNFGEENVDFLGEEFKDNLPVFVMRNVGDITRKSSSKINLKDNLDWMVHDLWHRMIDYKRWAGDYLNNTGSQLLDKFYKEFSINYNFFDFAKTFEISDAKLFLDSYNFTPGIESFDTVISLAALCMMKKGLRDVDEEYFRSKMKDYDSFRKAYRFISILAPGLWHASFKRFENKIVCINNYDV